MFKTFKKMLCKHDWEEGFSGAFADEPGGPRTMHYIHWTCKKCGKHEGDEPDYREYAPGEVAAPKYNFTARLFG